MAETGEERHLAKESTSEKSRGMISQTSKVPEILVTYRAILMEVLVNLPLPLGLEFVKRTLTEWAIEIKIQRAAIETEK